MTKDILKLYLVLETGMLKMPLEQFIPAVIKNGVTAIQLRDKDASAAERFATGEYLTRVLSGTGVLFVVNDRIDIAKTIGARAVHLGIKDIPLLAAKKSFPDMVYGYSCNDEDDIKLAKFADYIGVGPAFTTSTKSDLRPVIGPEGIKKLIMRTGKPAVAIGGINLDNIMQLKGTGIAGVAVSSAICGAANPARAASALREKVEQL